MLTTPPVEPKPNLSPTLIPLQFLQSAHDLFLASLKRPCTPPVKWIILEQDYVGDGRQRDLFVHNS